MLKRDRKTHRQTVCTIFLCPCRERERERDIQTDRQTDRQTGDLTLLAGYFDSFFDDSKFDNKVSKCFKETDRQIEDRTDG
jgi:hypothetical protein